MDQDSSNESNPNNPELIPSESSYVGSENPLQEMVPFDWTSNWVPHGCSNNGFEVPFSMPSHGSFTDQFSFFWSYFVHLRNFLGKITYFLIF